MTRCQLVCIVIVSALLGAAGAAAAQSVANATIRGKVVDETGGALPGVTVTAASPALLVGQIAVATDSDGSYRVSELPIGGLPRHL